MAGVFGCHYALGNVPITAFGDGDETNAIYDLFFHKSNYDELKRQLRAMNLGDPDWRSFTPHMKRAFRDNPGTYCLEDPYGRISRAAVARHVILLNRRVMEMIVPMIRVNINAYNGYLRDRQGLTLIDRPCSDGYKKKWTPVYTDRLLD